MTYNGMKCKGECNNKPVEIRHKLNNFYEYNFKKGVYVCKECGHMKS